MHLKLNNSCINRIVNKFCFKLITILFLLIFTNSSIAQTPPIEFCGIFKKDSQNPMTGGKVFIDRFGNSYSAEEVSVNNLQGAHIMQCPNSDFTLLFQGSFEPEEENTICEVFQYLSGIIVPLQTNDVFILIAKTGFAAGNDAAATATPIWETDCGISNSIILESMNAGNDDTYLHGIIRVNSAYNDIWHTTNNDLPGDDPVPPTDLDLFSTVLHEALHVLGFASRISTDGTPVDIYDDMGNLIAETHFYSRWDQFLYGDGVDQHLINQLMTPIMCCSEHVFNTTAFPDMPEPVIQGCDSDIVFYNGSEAIAPINRDVDDPNSVDDGDILNLLSHLDGNCDDPFEDYVMNPSLPPGVDRRTLHDAELEILCHLGYHIDDSNPAINPAAACSNICDLIAVDDGIYFVQVGTTVNLSVADDLLINDLVPGSYTINFNLDCGNSSGITVQTPTDPLAPNASVSVTADEFGLYSFCYEITGCNGFCQEGVVEIIGTLTSSPIDCDPNDCNLNCFKDFEDFLPLESSFYPQSNLTPFVFEGTIGNTPDIAFSPEDNRFLILSRTLNNDGHQEGVYIPLRETIPDGCTITIEYQASSNAPSNIGTPTVLFFASENAPCTNPAFPPCDQGVNNCSSSDFTTYCMNSNNPNGILVNSSIIGGNTQVQFNNPSNQYQYPYNVDIGPIFYYPNPNFGTYTLEWTNDTGGDINYVTIYSNTEDVNPGDPITSNTPGNINNMLILLDDISITTNCENDIEVIPTVLNPPCIDETVTIEYFVCLNGDLPDPTDVTLSATIPPGLYVVPGGDFDTNGETLITGLTTGNCEYKELVLFIEDVFPANILLDIEINVIPTNACVNNTDDLTVTLEIASEFTTAEFAIDNFCSNVVTFIPDAIPGDHYWTFGDGNDSYEDSPTHTYQVAQDYFVEHTVTNACGGSATHSEWITIEEWEPDPAFTFSFNDCSALVNFMALGQGFAHVWTYPGGQSSGPDPEIDFEEPGDYLVTHTVYHVCGIATTQQTVTVPEWEPNPNFEYETDDCSAVVQFTSLGQGAVHEWVFSNGEIRTEADPQVNFVNAGTYWAIHTITNDCGTAVSDPQNIVIVLDEPNPDFDISTDVCTTLVQFTSLGQGISHEWTFSNGDTSDEPDPSSDFVTVGIHSATHTIETVCGTETITKTFEITLDLPNPDFDIDMDGCSPVVQFTSLGQGFQHTWNFYDSNGDFVAFSAHPDPEINFVDPGVYTATHTIANSCGNATTSQTFEVVVMIPDPDFDILIDDCGNGVQFTSLEPGNTHQWFFSDGQMSTEEHPFITFNSEGPHTAQHIVTNNCGQEAELTQGFVIDISEPDPSFDILIDDCGSGVQFTSLETGNSHEWFFSDGQMSTEEHPFITFSSEGPHTAQHKVTNDCGEEAELTQGFVIDISEPDPSFDMNPVDCSNSVQFTSPVVGTHLWTFPDNSTSNLQNPSFTFDEGTGTVTHQVTDNCGTATESKVVTVVNGNSTTQDLPPGGLFNQFLIVNGTLTIDQDYFFYNVEAFIDTEGKIVVKNGVQFRLINSHLQGCNDLWYGIVLETGGHISAVTNIIEDAAYALYTFGAPVNSQVGIASAYMVGNTFLNNFISLYVPKGSSGVPQNVNFTAIGANTFDCPGTLKPTSLESESGLPDIGQKSFAGVWVAELTDIAVGNSGLGTNVFRNLANGIYAERTKLTVDNSIFEHIVYTQEYAFQWPPFATGSGIHVDGKGGSGFSLTQTGLGMDQSSTVTFLDCLRGIYVLNAAVSATQNYMQEVSSGILVSQALNNVVNTSYNRIEATSRGILLAQNDYPLAVISVTGNNITMDNSSYGKAIVVYESLKEKAAASITSNVITMNDGIGGIEMIAVKETDLLNNNITLSDASSLAYGIKLQSCKSGLLEENQIYGADVNMENVIGIDVFSTPFIKYCCNKVFDTDIGIQFEGMCQSENYFAANEFNNHNIGLRLGNSTVIDVQIHRGNKWENLSIPFGAIHSQFDIAINSRFEVNSDDATFGGNSNYLPLNIQPSDWFDDNTDVFNDVPLCGNCMFTLIKRITEFDDKLANDAPSLDNYIGAVRWHAERNLYEKLQVEPILIVPGSAVDSFASLAQTTPIGSFYSLDQGKAALWTMDEASLLQWNTNVSDMQLLIDGLRENDNLLLTANPTDSATIVQEKLVLLDQLAVLLDTHNTLNNSVISDTQSDAANLLNDNSNISTVTIFETNEQVVNDIYLQTVPYGISEFSATEQSDLSAIANQCPIEGGDAVMQARSLLLSFVDETLVFDDETLCTNTQAQGSPQVYGLNNEYTEVEYSIFPNPADESVTLFLKNAFEQAQMLKVYDISGKELSSFLIPENVHSFTFETNTLQNGLYVCKVYQGKTILFSDKLTILR